MTNQIKSAIQKSIFGGTIRTLRQACGYSIEDFASATGMDNDRIENIERGLASVDVFEEIPSLAEGLAKHLQVGTQTLISALRQSHDMVEEYDIFTGGLSQESLDSVKRGLEQAANGQTHYLGSFIDLDDQGEDE